MADTMIIPLGTLSFPRSPYHLASHTWLHTHQLPGYCRGKLPKGEEKIGIGEGFLSRWLPGKQQFSTERWSTLWL